MSFSRVSPKLTSGILVGLFFAVALTLRVYLPYDEIFTADGIRFAGADAYYHMRLVDNLVHNFPHLATFDPYMVYPGGAGVGGIHFFDWLLAGTIWIIGLGSPTARTIDVVGVYFPAVLAALTVIPVYFIGKQLFGRWAGILSAGLLAVLSGEFLGRSILGFTDHHVAETLLSAVTMLFLILAVKAAGQRGLTFSHLKDRDWAVIGRPVLYSLLAGVFMGAYIFTFLGALLFALIAAVYLVIQFVIDHLKHKSTDYLCVVGVVFFSVALVMSWLISAGVLYRDSLIVALLMTLVLSGLSRLMTATRMRPAYYPLTVIGLGLAGVGLFYLIWPSQLSSMLGAFRIFSPTGASLTTIEMQPFLSPGGEFTFAVAWGNFNTSFFLGGISLLCLAFLAVKQGSAEKSLLVVWSLVILAATLGQRRFAYYLAVNVALLTSYLSVVLYYIVRFVVQYLRDERTGYMSWRILELPSDEELMTQPARPSKRAERKRAERLERKRSKRLEREKAKAGTAVEARLRTNIGLVSISLWLVFVVFLLGLFPNIGGVAAASQAGATIGDAWWHSSLIGAAIDNASRARFAPSVGWMSALSWMKENTPDPFGNPDAYYRLETGQEYSSLTSLKQRYPNPSGDPDFYRQLDRSYPYPESAYGVLAWWDYGYWITRIAHRIPNANPSQDPRALIGVASFFTSQDEDSASKIARELGSAYVIVDHETALGKFYAMVTWVGKDLTEFYDIYFLPEENKRQTYIHEEYYRSLSTRLYNFDGKAVVPESTLVISFQKVADQRGNLHKVITKMEQFDSYDEAQAYLLSLESGNHRIVGLHPFISPVPLAALEDYQLVYSSDSSVSLADGQTVPQVKVFEYVGEGEGAGRRSQR